jgi:YidC/Oxa1 family membrane protein insertase
MNKFFLILIFFTSIQNPAYAYIDPGGVTAFIQLLFAGLITSFFFLKNTIKNILQKINFFLFDLRQLLKFFKTEKKIVIFCESSAYSKYFYPITKTLARNGIDFLYLCKKSDKSLSSKDINAKFFLEFNNQFFLLLTLSIVECQNLILTTPDFGKSKKLKISKRCKKVIYIFHSAVSSGMIYNEGAFDGYDYICCVGPHHFLELSERYSEKKQKNHLVKFGYPYLDYLIANAEKNNFENNLILIAPTWYPEYPDYYQNIYKPVIEDLLQNKFKVMFRPHPEYLKRFSNNFYDFKQNFSSNQNFEINIDDENLKIMQKSNFLITDWSGIAFEYAYTFLRPVIFVKGPKKILNKNYAKFQNLPIEITDREELGEIWNPREDHKISDLIQKIKCNEIIYKEKITKNLEKNIYNFGKSSEEILKLLN